MFRSFVVSGPSSTMPSLLRKGIPLNSRVLERIRCLHSVLEEQQLVNETTSKKMTRLLTGARSRAGEVDQVRLIELDRPSSASADGAVRRLCIGAARRAES